MSLAYLNSGKEESLRHQANLSESTDRGSLLVFGNEPLDWNNPDVLAMQAKAREELDGGAFYDKVTNQKPAVHFL